MLFIISVLLLLAGAGVLIGAVLSTRKAKAKAGDDRYSHDDDSSTGRKVSFGVAVGLLVLSGLFLLFSMLYRQDVGEAVVITTPGGEIAAVDTDAGFGIKAPWNGVVVYDTRNQVITFTGDGQGEGVSGPAIVGQTKDGTAATVDLTVRYSINPASVGEIYREYRTQDNLVTRALFNDVRSVVRDETIAFPTTTMRQERGQLSLDIQNSLDTRWENLGVFVDSVDLRNIGYPVEIEDSLKQVQTALNNVERAKAELETSRVEAEKIKTEAQAQSDADQIIRCGATTTTVKEMVNGKEITAIKVIPVPSNQCQNRLNEQVLTAKYIEMLRQAATGGNTVYVIPPDANSLLNIQGKTGTTPPATPTP